MFNDTASESVFANIGVSSDEPAAMPLNFSEARANWISALNAEAERLHASPDIDLRDADIRFSSALNLREVRNAQVCIIGAGGLGNWQWRILASMGFKRIAIYDDDVVGLENIGPQAHSLFDIGLPKVEAVANAALQYRGMRILARNRRVAVLQDIVDDLGCVPNIIIGCTDSAEFRNGFIRDLMNRVSRTTGDSISRLPEVFLDFRMALGDWCCYAIPVRLMRRYRNSIEMYRSAAIFSQEEALQEACTERAISYTGAGAAAFTGAFLHWFYGGGRAWLSSAHRSVGNYFGYDISVPPSEEQGAFSWYVSYSSRDWEPITDTPRVKKLTAAHKKKIDKMEGQINDLRTLVLVPYGLHTCHAIAWTGENFESYDHVRKEDTYVDLPGIYNTGVFRIIKGTDSGIMVISIGQGSVGMVLSDITSINRGSSGYEAACVVNGVLVSTWAAFNSDYCPLSKIASLGILICQNESAILRNGDGRYVRWRKVTEGIEIRVVDTGEDYFKTVMLEKGDVISNASIPTIFDISVPKDVPAEILRAFETSEMQAAGIVHATDTRPDDAQPRYPDAVEVTASALDIGDMVLLFQGANELHEVVSLSDGVMLKDMETDEIFFASRRQANFWRVSVEGE